jgi:hypothetical protein
MSALFGITGGNPAAIDVKSERSNHHAARAATPTAIENPPQSRGQDRSNIRSRNARSDFPLGDSAWRSALPFSRGSTNLI